MRFAYLAFAAVLPLAAACVAKSGAATEQPVVVNPGSTLTFSPSKVDASRFASACGVSNPPYGSPGEVYSLDVIGAQAQGPLTALEVTFEHAVAPGTSYDLVPDAPVTVQNPGGADRTQNATASDGVTSFQFQWGLANPGEIDPNALDRVGITVVAFPSQDGDPMTVRYVLHFTDGQTLDATFSAPTSSSLGGCAAG